VNPTLAPEAATRVGHPVHWCFLMTLDPIALTRRLVDIESITYNEGAVGAYLEEFLAGRGWAVETMPVAQPKESGSSSERKNVYACAPGDTPEVVFSTHMDTVPPFIPSSEDEEFVYGRGSCDAKGIIAAQIAAAECLRGDGVKAGLLFVVGEERDSAGAKAANLFAQERGGGSGFLSRFLINGEPTDNRVALASKGALRAVVRTTGKMAHSAYPELGESATHKMVEALRRVLEIKLPVTDDVGPSTLNVGTIHGGYAPNVIADAAEAQVLVRLVGDSAETRRAIEQAVAGLGAVDFTLEIPFKRLKAVEGLPTMVAAFTTDVPWLGNWGEPVLLGPGSIHVAHTPDERLRKKELLEAVGMYVEVGKRLVGATDAG
jgi:acetylornithine deacetylase